MTIRKSTLSDTYSIIEIAEKTWPETYSAIISAEQIRFMLDKFYNETIIKEQLLNEHHHFFMAEDDGEVLGYAHIFLLERGVFKLSKLYILPNQQGKQIGKKLLDTCEDYLISVNHNKLVLNVNRYNKAKDFYIKNGYSIIETIDIPLEQFWLNDYIMEKIFN